MNPQNYETSIEEHKNIKNSGHASALMLTDPSTWKNGCIEAGWQEI